MANKDWITVQPSLEPILRPINAVLATIDSVLSFLIALLNVANVILNVIKVFLIGLLDPIRAIVEAIIEEIRAFINDLRQLGVYLTGDFKEIEDLNTIEFLRGGYGQYENRMLRRLLNRRDSTRPDFTSRSAVVALFVYLSSGDIFALIELIQKFRAFFGDRNPRGAAPYPSPTAPEYALGMFGQSASLFRSAGEVAADPDAVTLTWAMPNDGGLFTAPPAGFLIHVSTLAEGFGVRTLKALSGDKDTAYLTSAGIDPTNGTELRLYGGVDDLQYEASLEIKDPQANRLYLSVNQGVPLIPPSQVKDLAGMTYFAGVGGFSKLFPGASFTATLKLADLPPGIAVTASNGTVTVESTPVSTFYVRVRAVSQGYVDRLGPAAAGTLSKPVRVTGTQRVAQVTADMVRNTTKTILRVYPTSDSQTDKENVSKLVGAASAPTVLSVPNLGFVQATKNAFALMLLVRADYTEARREDDGSFSDPIDPGSYLPGTGTGLEDKTNRRFFAESVKPKVFEMEDPVAFRTLIRRRAEMMADRFLAEPPPDGVVSALADQIETLTTFQWEDINTAWEGFGTIWESLENADTTYGIAANPVGFPVGKPRARLLRGPGGGSSKWITRSVFPETEITARTSNIFTNPGAFYMGSGCSDNTPVLYRADSTSPSATTYPLSINFIRSELVLDFTGPLEAAATLLRVVGAANSPALPGGSWLNIRLFDEALAPLDTLLTQVEKFLLGILDGLQGMIDKIIAYIEAIQARIFQLQQLIELIRSLLRALTAFDLPSASGLLLVENGTDGVVAGLVSSGNKPNDSTEAYGGGVLVMAGGLPVLLLEILELLLGGDE